RQFGFLSPATHRRDEQPGMLAPHESVELAEVMLHQVFAPQFAVLPRLRLRRPTLHRGATQRFVAFHGLSFPKILSNNASLAFPYSTPRSKARRCNRCNSATEIVSFRSSRMEGFAAV